MDTNPTPATVNCTSSISTMVTGISTNSLTLSNSSTNTSTAITATTGLANGNNDLDELTMCGFCKLKFNDTDQLPKLLSCKHHFCLQCIRNALTNASGELYCIYCWKRTDLDRISQNGAGVMSQANNIGSSNGNGLSGAINFDSLPTYHAILQLTKNLSNLKLLGNGALSPKPLSNNINHSHHHTSPTTSCIQNGPPSNATQQAGLVVNTSQSAGSSPTSNSLLTPSKHLGNNVSNDIAAKSSLTASGQSKHVSENCHTHAMPLAFWCHTCGTSVCRACASNTSEHLNHSIKSYNEAREQIVTDVQMELVAMTKILTEIQRLGMQQRDFLLKILEACITLKTHIETDLTNGVSHYEVNDARDMLQKARNTLTLIENNHLHDVHSLQANLVVEKQKLQIKYQEMYLQCQLDDLIRNSPLVFDFQLLKQALTSIHNGEIPAMQLQTNNTRNTSGQLSNPILFLANYCMSQLYSRHILSKQQQMQNGGSALSDYSSNASTSNSNSSFAAAVTLANSLTQCITPTQLGPGNLLTTAIPPPGHQLTPPPHLIIASPKGLNSQSYLSSQHDLLMPHSPQAVAQVANAALVVQQSTSMMRTPSGIYPLYYFQIDVNGQPHGRLVIEVRPDVAPKMAKNFGVLSTGECGFGYKGCSIFQCWEGESVITGDFEMNNGRGGRSIYEDGYFMPDDTKLSAIRGAVGMRRTQKRHDNLGMVGSQFRIILQEMRGFTAILGHVVEGLELVEKISTYGDTAGKPTKSVIVTKCGKL